MPSGNGCFLKRTIYIFRKDFSMDNFQFIQSYKRRTKVMTRCRIPEFCERYKIDIEIHDLKGKKILPRTVKQRDVCLYIHKNQYFVNRKKNRKDALLNGVEGIEGSFKYVKITSNKDKLGHGIRYSFPRHETVNQLENTFVFDLETYNDQEFAEAYAAGLYDLNRLRDRWDRELTPDEIVTEKDSVIVFDGSNQNPDLNMPKYISENYKGEERTCFDKDGDELVSSYGLLLVAHNASGFDSWVVLNSLVKEITSLEIVKTARGLISLSIRCGFKIGNSVEVPQYVKFACLTPHMKGSLDKIGREYGLQPELLKG